MKHQIDLEDSQLPPAGVCRKGVPDGCF